MHFSIRYSGLLFFKRDEGFGGKYATVMYSDPEGRDLKHFCEGFFVGSSLGFFPRTLLEGSGDFLGCALVTG